MARMAHKQRKAEFLGIRSFGTKLGLRGRVVLPAEVRSALKVSDGDDLVFVIRRDGTVQLVSPRDQVRRLRGRSKHLKRPGESVVDELIRDRREEAAQE